MKVVLCGPPHSGKSCLRFGLKEAIKAIPRSPYPYFITACLDGEGSWFQETTSESPDLAKALKAAHKGKLTEETANLMGEWVKNCSIPLTLIDIGGIPDAKNETICAYAIHAILLYSTENHLQEWREFCSKLKLELIAEIHSDYKGASDKSLTLGQNGVYSGSIHHLERGDLTVQHRQTVIELAHLMVGMVSVKEG